MIKTIIWDFDGTLYDTYPEMERCFIELSGGKVAHGKAMSLLKVSLQTGLDYLETLGFGDTLALRKKFKTLEREENFKPFDGVKEMLEATSKAGVCHFVYTHRHGHTVELLEKFGLKEYFLEIITEDYHFPRKPALEGYEYLIEKHQFDPRQTLMVGDRLLDLIGPRQLGMKTCLIIDEFNVGTSTKEDYYVLSPKDVAGIVLEPTEVKIFEPSDERDLKFVIASDINEEGILLVKHEDRTTFEFPGGHIEEGESTDQAVKREAYEELACREGDFTLMMDYGVARQGDDMTYGRIYSISNASYHEKLEFEIEATKRFKFIPSCLTYPSIIPYLYNGMMAKKRNE